MEEGWGISDIEFRFFTSNLNLSRVFYARGFQLPIGFTQTADPSTIIPYSPCFSACGIFCQMTNPPSYCISCPSKKYLGADQCENCDQTCESCSNSVSCDVQKCSSPSSDIYFWDDTCGSSCDSPLVLNYFASKIKYCEFPCSNSTKFLYWEGSCLDYCNSTLTQTTIHGKKLCIFSCGNSQYLYWDGTCRDTCIYPLRSETFLSRKFCYWDCNNNNDYLAWNKACIASCEPPLSTYSVNGRKLCNFTCPDGYFLHKNGSCLISCLYPFISNQVLDKFICIPPCAQNFYYYWNRTCLSSCPGYFIKENYLGINRCFFPCNSTQFLYWNGSCLEECHFPHRSSNTSAGTYCIYPCQAGYLLHLDGTCIADCNAPFFVGNVADKLYCLSPCIPEEYLYPDSSCGKNCTFPLANYSTTFYQLCFSPCVGGMYLFPNGTCFRKCPQGYLTQVRNYSYFCDIICPNNFYHYSGNCTDKCIYPLRSTMQDNAKQCLLPCPDQYFNLSDYSCISRCPYPYIIKGSSFGQTCDSPCNSSTYYYNNETCNSDCIFPEYKSILENIKVCIFKCDSPFILVNGTCTCPFSYEINSDQTGCDVAGAMKGVFSSTDSLSKTAYATLILSLIIGSNPILLIGLLHLMQSFFYLNFMNINYPEILKQFLDMFSVATLPFLESMFGKDSSSSTKKSIQSLEAPSKFLERGYSGYFLATGGTSFFLPLLMIPLVFALKKYVKKHYFSKRRINILMKNVLDIVRWSLLIRIWLSSYLKISIASFLQLRAMNFSTIYFAISSVIGALVGVTNIILPFFVYKVLKRNDYLKMKFYTKKIEALYEDYHLNLPRTKYFMIIVIFARLMMSASLVFSYEKPIVQNIIPWASNSFISIAYLYLRPHKKKINNLINIVYHLGFTGIHTCLVFLTLYDDGIYDMSDSQRESLGLIIIFLCFGILIIKFVLLITSSFTDVYNLVKTKLKLSKNTHNKFKIKRNGIRVK